MIRVSFHLRVSIGRAFCLHIGRMWEVDMPGISLTLGHNPYAREGEYAGYVHWAICFPAAPWAVTSEDMRKWRLRGSSRAIDSAAWTGLNPAPRVRRSWWLWRPIVNAWRFPPPITWQPA